MGMIKRKNSGQGLQNEERKKQRGPDVRSSGRIFFDLSRSSPDPTLSAQISHRQDRKESQDLRIQLGAGTEIVRTAQAR